MLFLFFQKQGKQSGRETCPENTLVGMAYSGYVPWPLLTFPSLIQHLVQCHTHDRYSKNTCILVVFVIWKWIYILVRKWPRLCFFRTLYYVLREFPGGSVNKEFACNAGGRGLIPGSGRSPGEGNGYPRQHSCLGNPMAWGAWWATVHRVARVRHDLETKQSPPLEKENHLNHLILCL